MKVHINTGLVTKSYKENIGLRREAYEPRLNFIKIC